MINIIIIIIIIIIVVVVVIIIIIIIFRNWKTGQISGLCQRFRKLVEQEGDSDDNCTWSTWNVDMQTGHLISARPPDLLIVNKKREPAEL